MLRWRNSFVLAVLAATAPGAQPPSQRPSVDVRRVGHRLACQCGCPDTVATCAMLECSFSKPAKEKIAKLQAAAVPDRAIVDQFIKEYGQQIYRAEPNAFGWIVPYAALVPGLLMIWWFVRRYYRHKPAAEVSIEDEAGLSRYREQIEKDLAQLE